MYKQEANILKRQFGQKGQKQDEEMIRASDRGHFSIEGGCPQEDEMGDKGVAQEDGVAGQEGCFRMTESSRCVPTVLATASSPGGGVAHGSDYCVDQVNGQEDN